MTLQRLLLISGPIHVGKSCLASELKGLFGFDRISSRQYLARQLPPGLDPISEEARELLQEIGDRLDLETDYRWIVDPAALEQINASPQVENWLVDAVRKPRQIDHFKNALPNVRHVHLVAPEDVLIARHQHSMDHYNARVSHPNEVISRSLGSVADLVLDTTRFSPREISERVMHLWEG